MIFSVSNEEKQWALELGPDTVTITIKGLEQKLTISSQEIPLAAWQLLLSQRQDSLDDYLPRLPIIHNYEETIEMRHEVLSSVGAQGLDSSSYQVSDLEDIEFNRENSQLDIGEPKAKSNWSISCSFTISSNWFLHLSIEFREESGTT